MPEFMKKLRDEEKKAPKKPDVDAMIARVYRLRILQGKMGDPPTIARYKAEEDELLGKLSKLGVKEDKIQEAIDIFSGRKPPK